MYADVLVMNINGSYIIMIWNCTLPTLDFAKTIKYAKSIIFAWNGPSGFVKSNHVQSLYIHLRFKGVHAVHFIYFRACSLPLYIH